MLILTANTWFKILNITGYNWLYLKFTLNKQRHERKGCNTEGMNIEKSLIATLHNQFGLRRTELWIFFLEVYTYIPLIELYLPIH